MPIDDILTPADRAKFDATVAGTGGFVITALERTTVEESLAKAAEVIRGLTPKPPPPPQYPVSFVIVDASSAPIDPAKLDDKTPFSVLLVPNFPWNKAIHKAAFAFDGVAASTEASMPLCLYGDVSGKPNVKTAKAGQHVLTAQISESGKLMVTPSFTFDVKASVVTPPPDEEPPPVTTEFKPPFPFKDEATALAWYRGWFKANTGCRIPESQLKVVSGFKAVSGTKYSGLLVKGTIDCNGTKDVVIEDCIIDGGTGANGSPTGSRYGIKSEDSPAAGLKVSWVTIRRCDSAGIHAGGTASARAKFNNIRVTEIRSDGAKFRDYCDVDTYWCDKIGFYNDAAHADVVQSTGWSNIAVRLMFADIPKDVPNTDSGTAMLTQKGATNITVVLCISVGGNNTWFMFTDVGKGSTISLDQILHFPGSAKFSAAGSVESGVKLGRFINAVTGGTFNPKDN